MENELTVAAREIGCAEVMGGNHEAATAVRLPGLSGFVYSKPCGGAKGGDIHYLTSCFSGMTSRVCLADVAGHGAQVSQASAWLHELLRGMFHHHNPSHTFRALNRRMVQNGFGAIATAPCLSCDSNSGTLAVCNAGHPPGLIWTPAAANWRLLEQEAAPPGDATLRDLILGADASARYSLLHCPLQGHERFFLYSDGVIETRDQNAEMFGLDNLLSLLQAHWDASDAELVTHVLVELARRNGSSNFAHDDITLMALTAEPPAAESRLWRMTKNMWNRAFN